VATVRETLADETGIEEVIFCCFSEHDLEVYRKALSVG
jgi:O-acetyl-ADP-ribose deacetylase (regulator of RNase III)